MTLSICVIIPAYNHAAEVMTAITSLRAFRADAAHTAIHVQDDASPEVMLPGVVPPEVATVWRNVQNQGFGANCNLGARWVAGFYKPLPDIYFFVNQDVYGVPQFSQGWDDALRAGFADEHVGVVGARLLFPDGSIQNMGGEFDALGQPIHRMLGFANPLAEITTKPGEVEWTTGAALAIRRTVFEELEGFNEEYARGYFEDVDLCLRARVAGYAVRVEPACTLIHQVGSTGGSKSFMDNARRFKAEWVDSGRITPGTRPPSFRWW